MLNKLMSLKNKKGFTLVELIVVLVILAILLAILVPAMTKWIDRAKEKQVLTSARVVYMACQTIASEEYAKSTKGYTAGTAMETDVTYAKDASYTITKDGPAFIQKVADLSDVKKSYKLSCTIDESGTVTAFVYTAEGKVVTLNTTDGQLEVTKA